MFDHISVSELTLIDRPRNDFLEVVRPLTGRSEVFAPKATEEPFIWLIDALPCGCHDTPVALI